MWSSRPRADGMRYAISSYSERMYSSVSPSAMSYRGSMHTRSSPYCLAICFSAFAMVLRRTTWESPSSITMTVLLSPKAVSYTHRGGRAVAVGGECVAQRGERFVLDQTADALGGLLVRAQLLDQRLVDLRVSQLDAEAVRAGFAQRAKRGGQDVAVGVQPVRADQLRAGLLYTSTATATAITTSCPRSRNPSAARTRTPRCTISRGCSRRAT